MSRPSFVIFANEKTCKVGTFRGGDVALTDEYPIADVAEVLKSKGYHGGPTVLALPTGWCLCGTIQMDGIPRQYRRQAMLYRFEEKLPLSADDLVADFAVLNGQALAVCVAIAEVRPILEALELAGVAIHAICPATLLAVQAVSKRGRDWTIVWEREQGMVEIIAATGTTPHEWYQVAADEQVVSEHLLSLHRNPDKRQLVTSFGSGAAFRRLLGRLENCDVSLNDEPPLEHAAILSGASILTGSGTPAINLRRDALAAPHPLRHLRAPVTAFCASILLFTLCFVAAVLVRAEQYSRQAHASRQQQQRVFQQAFPTASIPVGVRLRLVSEERRLRGVAGTASTLPHQLSALQLLVELLTRLPADLRYRVLELRIAPERVFLDGQARSHADVDQIAAALARGGLFTVESPRTEQVPGNAVSFALNAVVSTNTAGTRP